MTIVSKPSLIKKRVGLGLHCFGSKLFYGRTSELKQVINFPGRFSGREEFLRQQQSMMCRVTCNVDHVLGVDDGLLQVIPGSSCLVEASVG